MTTSRKVAIWATILRVTGVLVGLSFEARHGAEAQMQATLAK